MEQAVRWVEDFSLYGGPDGRLLSLSDPEFAAKYSEIRLNGWGMSAPQFYPSRFAPKRMMQSYSTANGGQVWFRPKIDPIDQLELTLEFARYGVNGSWFSPQYNSQLAATFLNATVPNAGITVFIDPYTTPSRCILYAYAGGAIVAQIQDNYNFWDDRKWRDNQNILQTMSLTYRDGVATAKVLSGGIAIADLTLAIPAGAARGPGLVEFYAVAEPGCGTEFHKINIWNGIEEPPPPPPPTPIRRRFEEGNRRRLRR